MTRGWVTACVESPRGNPTNHHQHDGLIGERVKPSEATLFIVVVPGFRTDVVARDW